MSEKMSDKRLLPCPFCGGEAEVVGGNPYHWVFCKGCDAETGQSATIEGAIGKWNTRKPLERIVERLEETKGKDIVFCPPRANGKTVKLGQRIGLDRAIEIVKEEM